MQVIYNQQIEWNWTCFLINFYTNINKISKKTFTLQNLSQKGCLNITGWDYTHWTCTRIMPPQGNKVLLGKSWPPKMYLHLFNLKFCQTKNCKPPEFSCDLCNFDRILLLFPVVKTFKKNEKINNISFSQQSAVNSPQFFFKICLLPTVNCLLLSVHCQCPRFYFNKTAQWSGCECNSCQRKNWYGVY